MLSQTPQAYCNINMLQIKRVRVPDINVKCKSLTVYCICIYLSLLNKIYSTTTMTTISITFLDKFSTSFKLPLRKCHWDLTQEVQKMKKSERQQMFPKED